MNVLRPCDLWLHIRVQRVDRGRGWRWWRCWSRLSAQSDDQSRCGAHVRDRRIGLRLTVPAINSRRPLPCCPAEVVVGDRERISATRAT